MKQGEAQAEAFLKKATIVTHIIVGIVFDGFYKGRLDGSETENPILAAYKSVDGKELIFAEEGNITKEWIVLNVPIIQGINDEKMEIEILVNDQIKIVDTYTVKKVKKKPTHDPQYIKIYAVNEK